MSRQVSKIITMVAVVAALMMVTISVPSNVLAVGNVIHHGGPHGGHGGFHHFGGHGGWGFGHHHFWGGHFWNGGICNSFAPWWVKQNHGCFFTNGFF